MENARNCRDIESVKNHRPKRRSAFSGMARDTQRPWLPLPEKFLAFYSKEGIWSPRDGRMAEHAQIGNALFESRTSYVLLAQHVLCAAEGTLLMQVLSRVLRLSKMFQPKLLIADAIYRRDLTDRMLSVVLLIDAIEERRKRYL